ncbi:aromatic ring-hydroxylating dioxygenase subunit alpha [Vacuolonema iberomarrocanum]|uniref:aromatic ring-hydroxylating dioxygenase subunit alpha n=1 Tax=Vacuolonema iberomarrocanum TaxID=3454632 RepID=UPI0019F6C3B7|nr:aromatic ring-hydroxylating dioxygenase subunit alpha [filamentous cyanobacterium LEGE 07170]
MELETTLRGHTVHNAVREVGINPNYWYPVSWSEDLKPEAILSVQIWQRPVALYRDRKGAVHAIEDACPHKGVELHKGKVEGDRIACPYHGWEFDAEGNCAHIPYLPEGQKLPCAQARVYPAQERYGLVWVFPGAVELAEVRSLPEIPEYDDPDCFMIQIPGHFHAHFSICNENTMDVFHGYLHENLQGWYNPQLLKLKETEESVKADYRVHYKGWITKVLGLSADGGVTTRTVSVHYQYPHYHSSMEGVSSLYLMRLPVGPEETRSFSMLFLRLPIPNWLINPIRKPLMRLVRQYFFMPFLLQDVEMMESEQNNYRLNAQRRYVEINPAIIALQRVILRQYTQFVQQSAANDSQQHDKHNAAEGGRMADGDIVRSPSLR